MHSRFCVEGTRGAEVSSFQGKCRRVDPIPGGRALKLARGNDENELVSYGGQKRLAGVVESVGHSVQKDRVVLLGFEVFAQRRFCICKSVVGARPGAFVERKMWKPKPVAAPDGED